MATHTLTRDGQTATFITSGKYCEIAQTTKQEIGVHEFEVTNEWEGWCKPTGRIYQQTVCGNSWTEVTIEKARKIWADMKAEGWA